ncbi:MAG: MATE family efflux transporter [Spirochaetia bacterium]|nr:MATE family efflux transporter [Spirochaetia bacterium]NCC89886.1 MATE family efflux transporter [Spirochaetia bacterium]
MQHTAEHANPLGTEPIFKLLMRFSIPAIVGMMVNALYNVVDRIFIGNSPSIGANGIAGITIAFPIMIILMALGVLFGIGGATLFSIRLGQKRNEEAEEALFTSFILLTGGGLVFLILGQIFMPTILRMFGASEQVLPYASSYLRVILMGSVFAVTSMGLNHFIRADGNPKVAMLSMFLGAGTNIILDPIFIYVLDWGMAGAALATIISQSFSFIWVISYFLGKRSRVKLRFAKHRIRLSVVRSIVTLGFPPFTLQIMSSILNVILNKTLILHGGDLGIAAMGIVHSLQTLLFMPVIGINQGVQPLISFNFGAKQYDRVKEAAKLGILSATAVILVGYAVTQLFPRTMVGMFNQDPALLNLGVYALRRWFLLTPLVGYQVIAGNFFQAIGKSKIALTLTLSRQGLFLIPAILLFAHFFGMQGILWSAPVADALSTVLTSVFFFRGMRDLEKKAAHI